MMGMGVSEFFGVMLIGILRLAPVLVCLVLLIMIYRKVCSIERRIGGE